MFYSSSSRNENFNRSREGLHFFGWTEFFFHPSQSVYFVFQNSQRYRHIENKGNAKRGVSPRLKIRPCDIDLCTKFGQNPLKDVDSRVFTRMLSTKYLTRWHWRLTLKINRVPDSPKDYVCTKFGQNPLKDVDSRVFTRMLRSKNLTRWHWPLTLKINRVPESPKD